MDTFQGIYTVYGIQFYTVHFQTQQKDCGTIPDHPIQIVAQSIIDQTRGHGVFVPYIFPYFSGLPHYLKPKVKTICKSNLQIH